MITGFGRKLLIKLRIQHTKGTMKMQKDPQAHIQRTGSQGRRQPLLLALAIMLLAANSAKATIMINAEEIGKNVVFQLSGRVDLSSLTLLDHLSFTDDAIAGMTPVGADLRFFPATAFNVDWYSVAPITGPGSFGSGSNRGALTPGTFDGVSQFLFYADHGYLYLPAGYNGTALDASLTFSGQTFDSLGIIPGMYDWTWSKGDFADNLILNIGQSVPDTGSTLALLGLGLGGVFALHRRRKLAAFRADT